MVPTDYRLDEVTARLIERLEGARPTHDDPDRALAAFREAAEKHVEAAVAEYAEVVADEDPSPHAEFLRREVLGTALPRYHRHAVAMTAAERGGYGFGRLAEPLGRLGLGVVSVLVLVFGLARYLAFPWAWPLVVLDLSLPLWPTIAAGLTARRYRGELEAIVSDMGRIQDAERAFLPRPALDAAREVARLRPRKQESER